MFFSVAASAVVVRIYNRFYLYRELGVQIERSFMLFALTITGIFIGIQFSLPLSLGLLGALSIIRFRVPVKDPEEVAYLMIIIASSILSATFNFILVVVLVAVAYLVGTIKEKYAETGNYRVRGEFLQVCFNPQVLSPQLCEEAVAGLFKDATVFTALVKESSGLLQFRLKTQISSGAISDLSLVPGITSVELGSNTSVYL